MNSIDPGTLYIRSNGALESVLYREQYETEYLTEHANLIAQGKTDEADELETQWTVFLIPDGIKAAKPFFDLDGSPNPKGRYRITVFSEGQYNPDLLQKEGKVDLDKAVLRGAAKKIVDLCKEAYKNTEFQLELYVENHELVHLFITWEYKFVHSST